MRVGIVILPEDRWWAAEPKWRAAEEYGFDHAWTYDHLGWRSLVDGPWFGAVPTLSAAAMVTSRIRLGTYVASPNFRHPVPFTRELITLDDLADGRLVLGVGAGGTGYDVDVFGGKELTPKQRADRSSNSSRRWTACCATTGTTTTAPTTRPEAPGTCPARCSGRAFRSSWPPTGRARCGWRPGSVRAG